MANPLASADWRPFDLVWALTFFIIAALLGVFSLIAFWGLTQSDWLYGTYGQISQAQWDQMVSLRDRLARLALAPEAVHTLNDALLLPHPSTEDVLFDLKKAAQALEPLRANAAARQIQTELYALIAEIKPDDGPRHTPWSTPTPKPAPTLTPIMDAPVA